MKASSPSTLYLLLVTQIISMLGSKMTSFALGIWLFTTTGDTTPLLLIPVFITIPVILFSNVAGTMADRFSRKWLIVFGDVGQVIPTCLLIVSFTSGQFALWQLYTAVFIQSLFDLLQTPAIEASITMLTPAYQRDRTNALLQIAQPISGTLGAFAAGAMYSITGVVGIMMIDVVTFIFAVVVVARLHIPQPHTTIGPAQISFLQQMIVGFKGIYQERGLFILILYFGYANFVTNGVLNLLTPYLLTLTADAAMVSLLLGLSSLGLVTGGSVVILFPHVKNRVRAMMIADGLAAIGLIVLGVTRSTPMLMLVIFLMQLPYKITNARFMVLLQNEIPSGIQGRTFALKNQIGVIAVPLSLLITGPIVDVILEPSAQKASWWTLVTPLVGDQPGSGMGLYIVICGVLYLIGVLFTYSRPAVLSIERSLQNTSIASGSNVIVEVD